MTTVFPVGAEEFPVLTEKRPGQFDASYIPWRDKSKGHVISSVANGSAKRPYSFEVTWWGGKPDVAVSTADSANTNDFGDRDGSEKPIRELKGMPKTHRRDIRAYALRVAEHVRNRVF